MPSRPAAVLLLGALLPAAAFSPSFCADKSPEEVKAYAAIKGEPVES